MPAAVLRASARRASVRHRRPHPAARQAARIAPRPPAMAAPATARREKPAKPCPFPAFRQTAWFRRSGGIAIIHPPLRALIGVHEHLSHWALQLLIAEPAIEPNGSVRALEMDHRSRYFKIEPNGSVTNFFDDCVRPVSSSHFRRRAFVGKSRSGPREKSRNGGPPNTRKCSDDGNDRSSRRSAASA